MFFKPDKTKSAGPVEYIIAGLGNPGKQYEYTRHNAGFLALDHLGAEYGIKTDRLKYKSLCGTGIIEGKRVLLLKPQTFMNNSGEAVRDAMSFYKIPPQRVIILFDDISLDVGKLRIRRKGSDGGHNGMKSILSLTGSDEFPRVKLGIGAKPHPDYDLADWVLSHFTKDEGVRLEEAIANAAQVAKLLLAGDFEAAMNRYNS